VLLAYTAVSKTCGKVSARTYWSQYQVFVYQCCCTVATFKLAPKPAGCYPRL